MPAAATDDVLSVNLSVTKAPGVTSPVVITTSINLSDNFIADTIGVIITHINNIGFGDTESEQEWITLTRNQSGIYEATRQWSPYSPTGTYQIKALTARDVNGREINFGQNDEFVSRGITGTQFSFTNPVSDTDAPSIKNVVFSDWYEVDGKCKVDVSLDAYDNLSGISPTNLGGVNGYYMSLTPTTGDRQPVDGQLILNPTPNSDGSYHGTGTLEINKYTSSAIFYYTLRLEDKARNTYWGVRNQESGQPYTINFNNPDADVLAPEISEFRARGDFDPGTGRPVIVLSGHITDDKSSKQDGIPYGTFNVALSDGSQNSNIAFGLNGEIDKFNFDKSLSLAIPFKNGIYEITGAAYDFAGNVARWSADQLGRLKIVAPSAGNPLGVIEGTNDSEWIYGNASDNTVQALNGDDYIIAGAGNDTILSGEGNDTIVGGAGNDTLNGGAGFDAADYTGLNKSISGDLSTGLAIGDGTDSLVSIENIIGGNASDTFAGDSGNNMLNGGNGDDNLSGNFGDDELIGGAGNDTLNGGAGFDCADYSSTTKGVNINIQTGIAFGIGSEGLPETGTDSLTGIEEACGGSGNDSLIAASSGSTLEGAAGNDTLLGDAGNDTLYGGDGNDTVDAGAGNDLIVGGDGAGDDIYNGGDGTDTVKYTSAIASITVNLTAGVASSTSGNDAAHIGSDTLSDIENIISGNFSDILIGSGYNNEFTGGSGYDTIDGKEGTDSAIYTGAWSNYTLTKYSNGTITVKDNRASGEGLDTLTNIENLVFADRTVSASSLSVVSDSGPTLPVSNSSNISISTAIASQLEGQYGLTTLYQFNVTRSGSTKLKQSFNYTVIVSGSNQVDKFDFYKNKLPTGTISFNPGETSKPISLYIVGDLTAESDEQFSVKLTKAPKGVSIITNQATGIIKNDDIQLDNNSTSYDGTPGNDVVYGMGGDDRISGNEGNDYLVGGLGNDLLTGGNGSDIFRFDSMLGPQNIDAITDFSLDGTRDKFELENSIFKSLKSVGDLKAANFVIGERALSKTQFIIYNQSNGSLFYDSDGSGTKASAVQFAQLTGVPSLSAGDFKIT